MFPKVQSKLTTTRIVSVALLFVSVSIVLFVAYSRYREGHRATDTSVVKGGGSLAQEEALARVRVGATDKGGAQKRLRSSATLDPPTGAGETSAVPEPESVARHETLPELQSGERVILVDCAPAWRGSPHCSTESVFTWLRLLPDGYPKFVAYHDYHERGLRAFLVLSENRKGRFRHAFVGPFRSDCEVNRWFRNYFPWRWKGGRPSPEGYTATAFKIVIENFFSSNEASTIASLKNINLACFTYAATWGDRGFPASLAQLAPGKDASRPTVDGAALIDSALASGKKAGYTFFYGAGQPDSERRMKTYVLVARPEAYGITGRYSFFTDQTAVIRFTKQNREPTVHDATIPPAAYHPHWPEKTRTTTELPISEPKDNLFSLLTGAATANSVEFNSAVTEKDKGHSDRNLFKYAARFLGVGCGARYPWFSASRARRITPTQFEFIYRDGIDCTVSVAIIEERISGRSAEVLAVISVEPRGHSPYEPHLERQCRYIMEPEGGFWKVAEVHCQADRETLSHGKFDLEHLYGKMVEELARKP